MRVIKVCARCGKPFKRGASRLTAAGFTFHWPLCSFRTGNVTVNPAGKPKVNDTTNQVGES